MAASGERPGAVTMLISPSSIKPSLASSACLIICSSASCSSIRISLRPFCFSAMSELTMSAVVCVFFISAANVVLVASAPVCASSIRESRSWLAASSVSYLLGSPWI